MLYTHVMVTTMMVTTCGLSFLVALGQVVVAEAEDVEVHHQEDQNIEYLYQVTFVDVSAQIYWV